MKKKNLILIFVLNLSFLNLYSQNNDSLLTSQVDTTQSEYIIEFDTVEVTIKVTEVSSGKETLLTKKDKIKVKIVGGKYKSGRWEINDKDNIRVGEVTVPISVIENIKKKSKSGLITFSIGAGLMITGIIVVLTTMDYTGAGIFLVGSIVTIVSIPISISNYNKRKAKAFVGVENLGLIGNPYSNTKFISVGLTINF